MVTVNEAAVPVVNDAALPLVIAGTRLTVRAAVAVPLSRVART